MSSLKLLGDYWTMMIIDMLSDGPMRFRDLEHKIENVNTATLTNRLKNMQASQLIERREISRADVTYELTDLGKKAVPILNAVNDFSGFVNKRFSNTSISR
ncbi:MAG TPA: helix-turn-helix domain-containing protein [Candidatus Saccharimonadales bacterium]|nr:helix-turn-helix domain-containing protein [Candidatus Saccharimonadales bacterium]